MRLEEGSMRTEDGKILMLQFARLSLAHTAATLKNSNNKSEQCFIINFIKAISTKKAVKRLAAVRRHLKLFIYATGKNYQLT